MKKLGLKLESDYSHFLGHILKALYEMCISNGSVDFVNSLGTG